jgi:hypothetical protein
VDLHAVSRPGVASERLAAIVWKSPLDGRSFSCCQVEA